MLVKTRNVVLIVYTACRPGGRRRRAVRGGRSVLHGLIASLLLSTAPAYASGTSTHGPPLDHQGAAEQKYDIATPRRVAATTRLRGRTISERYATARRPTRRSFQLSDSDADLNAAYDPDKRIALESDTGSNGGELIASGIASWYSADRYNRRTSSGEVFNENAMTAAHPWLPMGTRVRVTLEGTNESVIVTINDRQGCKTRVIDLSKAAARELGILSRGVARVTLTRS